MSSVAHVRIHATQFPETVRRDLFDSLRRRQVNHKFHYDSVRQTQQWLTLHQAWSPSRRDADCAAIYNRSFAAAAQSIPSGSVHVIGLGCGGGRKDARLLKWLKAGGRRLFYTPCDVSTAMVLVARRTALAVVSEANCFPLVCDLATARDLPAVFDQLPPLRTPRLLTFFGMIPNFEPETILPKLAALVRRRDFLLFSANLAPGKNYAVGSGYRDFSLIWQGCSPGPAQMAPPLLRRGPAPGSGEFPGLLVLLLQGLRKQQLFVQARDCRRPRGLPGWD